jgi:hypothetical protein
MIQIFLHGVLHQSVSKGTATFLGGNSSFGHNNGTSALAGTVAWVGMIIMAACVVLMYRKQYYRVRPHSISIDFLSPEVLFGCYTFQPSRYTAKKCSISQLSSSDCDLGVFFTAHCAPWACCNSIALESIYSLSRE